MPEKTNYRKQLERDIFYSYEAPFVIFTDFALDKIQKKYDITRSQFKVICAVRLFQNVRQFAKPYQVCKILDHGVFVINRRMRDMVEKGLLERVAPEVVKRQYNKTNIKRSQAYYRITPKGKQLIKDFNNEILELVRFFDEDRKNDGYKKLKKKKNGKIYK